MEDDPFLNADTGGNNEQIRRDSVPGSGAESANFEGTCTFTPEGYVANTGGREGEIEAGDESDTLDDSGENVSSGTWICPVCETILPVRD